MKYLLINKGWAEAFEPGNPAGGTGLPQKIGF
jgi:hypothetical protein